MVRPCTITIVALTFSTYACKPFFPECEPPDEAIRALAALCICKSLLHIICTQDKRSLQSCIQFFVVLLCFSNNLVHVSYALSFYRSQNDLSWSKFFEPSQKFDCIQCLFKNFCAGIKTNFTEFKPSICLAQNFLKRH